MCGLRTMPRCFHSLDCCSVVRGPPITSSKAVMVVYKQKIKSHKYILRVPVYPSTYIICEESILETSVPDKDFVVELSPRRWDGDQLGEVVDGHHLRQHGHVEWQLKASGLSREGAGQVEPKVLFVVLVCRKKMMNTISKERESFIVINMER